MFIMFHYEAIESKVLKPTTSDLRLGSQSTSHRVPSLLSSLRVLKNIFAQTIILWQLPSQAIIIFIYRTAYSLYKMLFSNEHMEESLWLKLIRLCPVLLGGASFWIVHCTQQLLSINIRLKEGTKRNLTNPTSRLTSIMKNHVEGSGMVHTCNPSTLKTTRTLAWKISLWRIWSIEWDSLKRRKPNNNKSHIVSMYSLYEVEGIAILIFIFHLQNILIMTKISENPARMTALLKTPRVFKSKGNLKTVIIKRKSGKM